MVAMSKTLLLSVMLVAAAGSAMTAQVPTVESSILDADQPRPSAHWRVLQTPHFRVVFPAPLEREAQRVGATLERVRPALGNTMGKPPKRTTIVLNDQSAISNAYMALAPRREVWVTVPPAFSSLIGTGDWLTLLGVHETRHATQQDRADVGFTRFGHLLFGDLGLAGLSHLAIPTWVWEGDAVGTETAFTTAGRGRFPDFDKEIRALAIDDRLPGYYEALLGSYSRPFPNEYPLGYLLTTSLRMRKGANAVADLISSASSTSFNPLSFHFALRAVSGQTPPAFYDRTMKELAVLWKRQAAAIHLTPAERLSPVPRVYTNYKNPQYLADGSIVAQQSGLGDLRAVVRVSRGAVTKLADAPTFADVRAGGLLVAWTEAVPDVRWGWSDATRIRIYDAQTGATRTIGPTRRWAFPNPSPDGKRIVLIEMGATGGGAVVIIDASTGARLFEEPVPNHDHAMDPSWRADGKALVLTRQGVRGKALSVLDLESRQWSDVIPYGEEDVSRPIYAGRHILYGSPKSGMDNVHAIDVESSTRFQVTARRVGAYQPAVSPDVTRLLFAEYTSDGFAVAESRVDTTAWVAESALTPTPVKLYETLVAQEGFTIDPAAVAADSTVTYPTRARRPTDFFSVHSWSLAGNPGAGEFGAAVLSTNVMNTFGTSASYTYLSREHAYDATLSASYAGLYPIIDVAGRYGTRAASFEAPGKAQPTRVTWQEQGIETGLRLPFNFSRGYWERTLWLGAHVEDVNVSDLSVAAAHPPGNGRFVPTTLGLTFRNVHASARRDAGPRRGFTLDGLHRGTPFGGDFSTRKSTASGRLFLPGMSKHHSLQLGGDIESHHTDNGFRFSSDLREARGYPFAFGPHMQRGSVDYVAPVAYPHLALGPVLYIPRLRAGVFGDYFRAAGGPSVIHQESAGVELMADVIPFSWSLFRLSAGMRVARRFTDGKWVVEPAVAQWAF
jgi:hypothetical protein